MEPAPDMDLPGEDEIELQFGDFGCDTTERAVNTGVLRPWILSRLKQHGRQQSTAGDVAVASHCLPCASRVCALQWICLPMHSLLHIINRKWLAWATGIPRPRRRLIWGTLVEVVATPGVGVKPCHPARGVTIHIAHHSTLYTRAAIRLNANIHVRSVCHAPKTNKLNR